MKLSGAGRRLALPAGALVALAACGLFAPAQAQAGCAHYVIYRSGQDQLSRFLDPSVIGQNEILPDDSAPSPGPPRPCSGPTCSDNQPMPPGPTLTEVRYVEPWAWLSAILSLPEPGSAHHLALPVDARRSVMGPGVFHPPRECYSRIS